jgi:hypothetical protein
VETNFLALYRGETVSGARIVALSADPQLVRDFAGRLLESSPEQSEKPDTFAKENESRQAVRIVRGERRSDDSQRGETQ